MGTPQLTSLQFALLDCFSDGELVGESVRQLLAGRGYSKSLGAFYQLMARVEDAKFVEGWYFKKIVGGHTIRERRYRLTAGGVAALTQTRAFYTERAPAVAIGRIAHAG
jgi:DNA-binding PadR family transcriptional regulator